MNQSLWGKPRFGSSYPFALMAHWSCWAQNRLYPVFRHVEADNSFTTSKPSGVSYVDNGRYFTTHSVSQKKANAWGLHDMNGNVEEWCLDGYTESLPGGSVTDPRGPLTGSKIVSKGAAGSALDGDAGWLIVPVNPAP